MGTIQKSLRIPDGTAEAIERLAEWQGRDFSAMANELLTEAVRMRHCPGITFADGPGGRRARLTGAGLDVWEVIAVWLSLDRSLERLGRAYDWLSESQLRAALGYYAAYPEEIDARIEREGKWNPERLREAYPALAADVR